MSTTTAGAPPEPVLTRPRSVQALRVLGWALIGAGVVVLLYVVYALWFTGFETERAQQQLHERWEREVAEADGAGSEPPDPAGANEAEERADDRDAAPDGKGIPSEAVAKLEFQRPGSDQRPVADEPLFVVEGVNRQALTRGPGHYPDTVGPGEDGNFAVAGHRTTYGAPFFSLEELGQGDKILVTDRSGQQHVYEFAARKIVSPGARWVLAEHPLDRGQATVTLTTCHPRFSAAQRMVVFGELVS